MDDKLQFTTNILDIAMPIIFFVWAAGFAILGVILKYHWKRYGVEKDKSKKMFIIYFVIGLILVGGMFASYLMYLMSK